MDDVGPERSVHGDGDAPLRGGEQDGGLAGRQLGAAGQVVRERLAHAFAGARAVGDRAFMSRPSPPCRMCRLPARGDIFARASVRGQLEVMDGGAAVERQMRDDAAPDELAEQGSQADLDDVPAEHRHDAAPPRGLGQLRATVRMSLAARISGSESQRR